MGSSEPEPAAPAPAADPQLDSALQQVVRMVLREHSLSPNQILILASELQRLGVHQLVEEHLRKYRYRSESTPAGSSE